MIGEPGEDLRDLGRRLALAVDDLGVAVPDAPVVIDLREPEVLEAKAKLEAQGYEVTGWSVGEVACHSGGQRLETRKHAAELADADAILVLACGAGVQTMADVVDLARSRGAETWLVNAEPADNAGRFDEVRQGPSGTLLPALLGV